jgi:hypothetical protein
MVVFISCYDPIWSNPFPLPGLAAMATGLQITQQNYISDRILVQNHSINFVFSSCAILQVTFLPDCLAACATQPPGIVSQSSGYVSIDLQASFKASLSQPPCKTTVTND